jgi:hypothetical protein
MPGLTAVFGAALRAKSFAFKSFAFISFALGSPPLRCYNARSDGRA